MLWLEDMHVACCMLSKILNHISSRHISNQISLSGLIALHGSHFNCVISGIWLGCNFGSQRLQESHLQADLMRGLQIADLETLARRTLCWAPKLPVEFLKRQHRLYECRRIKGIFPYHSVIQ